MKKKILLGLVLILCCFTGCSNGSSKKDDNNPPEIKMSDIETDDSDIEYFEAKNNNGDEIELSYNAFEQEVSCTISNDNIMSGDELHKNEKNICSTQ